MDTLRAWCTVSTVGTFYKRPFILGRVCTIGLSKVGVSTHIPLIRVAIYSKSSPTISRVGISEVNIWSTTISARLTRCTVSTVCTTYFLPFVFRRILRICHIIIGVGTYVELLTYINFSYDKFRINRPSITVCFTSSKASIPIRTIGISEVNIRRLTVRTFRAWNTVSPIGSSPSRPSIGIRIIATGEVEILVYAYIFGVSPLVRIFSKCIKIWSILPIMYLTAHTPSKVCILGSAVIQIDNSNLTS